jgi:hypothetical protein
LTCRTERSPLLLFGSGSQRLVLLIDFDNPDVRHTNCHVRYLAELDRVDTNATPCILRQDIYVTL